MPKYLFVYRGRHEGLADASPEQIQQMIQLWTDWIQDGRDAGWMLDSGEGLSLEGATVNEDLSVTDGPLIDSSMVVRGYSLIETNDLNTAVELAMTSPVPKSRGTVEVRELVHVGIPSQ